MGCTSTTELQSPLSPPSENPSTPVQRAHSLSSHFPFRKKGYQRASLITTSELSLLKKSDRLPVDKQRDVWAKEPTVFAGLWMGLLGKLVRVDTVGSVLVLMGDMIGGASLSVFPGGGEDLGEEGGGKRGGRRDGLG